MCRCVWRDKSCWAWGWLGGFIVAQIIIAVFAYKNWDPLISIGENEWQTRDFWMAVSMATLMLAAVLMHSVDKKHRHGGFLDVYRHTARGRPQDNEQLFIGPVLTVESTRAAMTAVLLAILVDNRKTFLKLTSEADPDWHSISRILADPAAVFFLVIVGILAMSLVTTMAELLCYEYATRFIWERGAAKSLLLKKAHRFGIVGFYCLMWSLAVIPVLMDYQLAFITIIAVFVVMWLYYFFPLKDVHPLAKFIVLYKRRSDGSAVSETVWVNHIGLLKAVPLVRCVDVSKVPVAAVNGTSSDYHAVAILTFESLEELKSGLESEEGSAVKSDMTNVTNAGVTLLAFEDERA